MLDSPSQIEINLTALDANYYAWRDALAPEVEICPVVKADAYGLGAVPITRRLVGHGVKIVAVYNMQQARELAQAGLGVTMLVLMPVTDLGRTDVLYRAAVADQLHLAVHSLDQLDQIESIGTTYGLKMPIHIEVDTGMSRLGMSIEQADAILQRIDQRRYIRLAGIFSHTAAPGCDSQFTREQNDRFNALLGRHAERLRGLRVHLAGTAAAYRDAAYHHRMVRLGLGLFGYGDLSEEGMATIESPPSLTPVVRWISRIVHVMKVEAGATIGYQRTFTTRRPSRLGVVPVGHADGYPCSLSNKAVVRVGPDLQRARIRGQINMDQLSIDLTSLPQSIGVGSEVEIISRDPAAPNALPRLAELANTHCYELLCRLSPHLKRHYVVQDRATGRVGHVATV